MAKQNAYCNSKAIPNLKSATISTLRTTRNIAAKGIEKTAKWLVTDNERATHRNHTNKLERSANQHLASMALSNRRLDRLSDKVHCLVNINVGYSTFEITVCWLIDHAFFIWCQLWGFIWSILSELLMAIISVLMIIIFNVFFSTQYSGFLFL